MALSLYQHGEKKCNNINILLIPVENLHYCNQLDFIWSNQKPQQNLMKFCLCVWVCICHLIEMCFSSLLSVTGNLFWNHVKIHVKLHGNSGKELWAFMNCMHMHELVFFFFIFFSDSKTISLKYDAPNISLLKWMKIKFVHILGLLTFLLKFHNIWKRNFHLSTSNVCMLFHMVSIKNIGMR